MQLYRQSSRRRNQILSMRSNLVYRHLQIRHRRHNLNSDIQMSTSKVNQNHQANSKARVPSKDLEKRRNTWNFLSISSWMVKTMSWISSTIWKRIIRQKLRPKWKKWKINFNFLTIKSMRSRDKLKCWSVRTPRKWLIWTRWSHRSRHKIRLKK